MFYEVLHGEIYYSLYHTIRTMFLHNVSCATNCHTYPKQDIFTPLLSDNKTELLSRVPNYFYMPQFYFLFSIFKFVNSKVCCRDFILLYPFILLLTPYIKPNM